MPRTTPPQDEPSPSFEASLERIREIVTALESGELSLEESIETYREGANLIEGARRTIDEAELRISELAAQPEIDA